MLWRTVLTNLFRPDIPTIVLPLILPAASLLTLNWSFFPFFVRGFSFPSVPSPSIWCRSYSLPVCVLLFEVPSWLVKFPCPPLQPYQRKVHSEWMDISDPSARHEDHPIITLRNCNKLPDKETQWCNEIKDWWPSFPTIPVTDMMHNLWFNQHCVYRLHMLTHFQQNKQCLITGALR